MSGAFTFNFEGEDEVSVTGHVPPSRSPGQDSDRQEATHVIAARLHSLDDILSSFPDHFSYSSLVIKGQHGREFTVARRELHDIRSQLMAEDESPESDKCPMPGLSSDDIVPKIYEGGFKTWECAMDLSQYLLDHIDEVLDEKEAPLQVVELGAGTAIPSLTLLKAWISCRSDERTDRRQRCLQLTIADYNQSVLELASLPNAFLTCSNIPAHQQTEFDVSPETLTAFRQRLDSCGVKLSAISGAWSRSMSELILQQCAKPDCTGSDMLVLASETIYSPESITSFAETLRDLSVHIKNDGGDMRVLIATKQIYFGVGGGLDEFVVILRQMNGQAKILWETQDGGVGRAIVEVCF